MMQPTSSVRCLNCDHEWDEHSAYGNCCANTLTCRCPGQKLDPVALRAIGVFTEQEITQMAREYRSELLR